MDDNSDVLNESNLNNINVMNNLNIKQEFMSEYF
jgi:hypothetical protein